MIMTAQTEVANLFFRCQIPGLPDTYVLVHLSEVEAVIEAPAVIPIPFAPSYVHGLARWNHEILTIIDLTAALLGNEASSEHLLPGKKFLVSRIQGEHKPYLIAWPLLEDANTISLPSKVAQADLSPEINSEMVLESILLDDNFALILNSGALNKLR